MLHKLFAGHSPGLLARQLQDCNCRIILLLEYKIGKSRSKQDYACNNNYDNHYAYHYFTLWGYYVNIFCTSHPADKRPNIDSCMKRILRNPLMIFLAVS